MNTDKAWERWGKTDPYYGVVALEEFHGDRIEETKGEFFQSGRQVVSSTIERFERAFGPLPRGRALDYGCGVGRLSLALADQFQEVVGLDISQSMLNEARKNAGQRVNLRFHVADSALQQAAGEFDFVNCYIVLQHIPIGRGLRIMRRLVAKTKPGGGFLIHFSVRNRGPFWKAAYWLKHNVPGVVTLENLLRGKSPMTPTMQMNPYPMPQILQDLNAAGINEVLMFTEMHGPVMTVGLIGRRP